MFGRPMLYFIYTIFIFINLADRTDGHLSRNKKKMAQLIQDELNMRKGNMPKRYIMAIPKGNPSAKNIFVEDLRILHPNIPHTHSVAKMVFVGGESQSREFIMRAREAGFTTCICTTTNTYLHDINSAEVRSYLTENADFIKWVHESIMFDRDKKKSKKMMNNGSCRNLRLSSIVGQKQLECHRRRKYNNIYKPKKMR